MTQKLLYTNTNPDPDTICPACLPFIGKVFEPGTEPPVPVHPTCYCTYFPTWGDATDWTWSDVTQEGRKIWVQHVVRLLRYGFPIPYALITLTKEAERWIAEHPEDEPEDDDMALMPLDPLTLPATVKFAGRLRLSPAQNGQPHSYDCLLIGAGRVLQADGKDSDWLIPSEVLLRAVPLFNGVASYVDHPAQGGIFSARESPSIRNLAGVILDPQWSHEEQGITGTLRLYDKDPNSAGTMLAALYDQILSDQAAGVQTPEIGLSAVIWHQSHLDEDTGLRITDEITQVDSIDHVYSAGARGYVRAALAVISAQIDPSGITQYPVVSEGTDHPSGAPAPGGLAMDPETQGQPGATNAVPARAASRDTRGTVPVVTDTPATSPTTDTILTALQTITARLDQIEQGQAQAAELATVEGMGTPPRSHVHGMTIGLDDITLAAEALLAGVRPPNGIRPLGGIRELYTLLSGDYEMNGLFNSEQIYLANVTSSTMAQIVANVLNKRVMNLFAEYPRWWERIVTIENFASLQDVRWITLGGVGELPTVAAGAAYTELTWDDLGQRDSFVKKGGYLGLTLEAIDKDDTRRIQMAPRALAQAAWLTLSKAISYIFTQTSGTGPTVYYDDSNTRVLFHSSNSNLGSTALSAAAWEATRIAMRKQTELNSGERLGALTAPKYCVVPPDLEFTAIQALATAHIPGSANYNVNPEAAGNTRDARLAAARERVVVVDLWTDTDNWAAVADPQLYPTIGLGFRFGPTPEIFSVADPRAGLMFSNDVMPVKARFFFATGPVDYRGLYKHNV